MTQNDRRAIRQAAHRATQALQRRLYETMVDELTTRSGMTGSAAAVLTDEAVVGAALRSALTRVATE